MSKKKKKDFVLDDWTDKDLTHVLEEKWGKDLTHIAPLGTGEDEARVFSCMDRKQESMLFIDTEGWVLVRQNNATYGDILGTIF